MTKLLVPVVAILGALALGVAAIDGGTPANAGTFHVDFDHGNDNNFGRQPGDAWKHAPGDPAATGKAKEQTLGPGSSIVFAPGVRYRGAIKLAWSGTPAAPITLTGGNGAHATIDGSDPVASVHPCASAEACGNAPNWQALSLITIGRPLTPFSAFFTDVGPLYEAQNPDPKDFFYSEEPEDLTPIDGNQLQQGMLALDPDIAAAIASGGPATLMLWVKANRIVRRPILRIEGATARFDPAGLQFYTDRPSRYAVAGHPKWIDRPGEYAVLPGGHAIVALLPAGTHNVYVASGRGGIDLNGQSYIVIRNLAFERMAGDASRTASGIPISSTLTESRGLTITGNRFSMIQLPLGQGVINLRKVSMVEIAGNSIDTVAFGSGMRISGPASTIRVERNDIRRIGRTGIMLMGVEFATVVQNNLTDIRGAHGNGVSAYLGNRGIRFIANTIVNAKQPATFHGNGGKPPLPNDILFANNLLIGTPTALGALISWGKSTQDVRIVRNVILGGEKVALRLSGTDINVQVSNNVTDGLVISGAMPNGWTIRDNAFSRLSFQQHKGPLTASLAGTVARSISRWDISTAPPSEICATILQRDPPSDVDERKYLKWVGAHQQCP